MFHLINFFVIFTLANGNHSPFQTFVINEVLAEKSIVDMKAWELDMQPHCPQQMEGTNDCGVFMMAWLEALFQGEEAITYCEGPAEIHKYRVRVLCKLLNDRHSYKDLL